MNREIKYNIWDKIAKRMYLWPILIDTYIGDENCVLLQYTGLKDKNGREIYEGDVVKCQEYTYDLKSLSPTGVKDTFLLCEFDNTGARFLLNIVPLGIGYGGYDFHNGMSNRIEIVGNQFENPELLK